MASAEGQLFIEQIHQLVAARGEQMSRRGPIAEMDFRAEESRARAALDRDAARARLDLEQADRRAFHFAQVAAHIVPRHGPESELATHAAACFPAELRRDP